MKELIEKFQKEQIEKANFIKGKAELKIYSLEETIQILKGQIKEQKNIIKQANKDIEHYSE